MNLTRFAIHPTHFKKLSTVETRDTFLIQNLFQKDLITFTYTHYDRMIIGGVHPVSQSIKLDPRAIIDLREFPSTISELRDYLHDELMIPFDQLITPDDFIAAINIDLADLIQNANFDFITLIFKWFLS